MGKVIAGSAVLVLGLNVFAVAFAAVTPAASFRFSPTGIVNEDPPPPAPAPPSHVFKGMGTLGAVEDPPPTNK